MHLLECPWNIPQGRSHAWPQNRCTMARIKSKLNNKPKKKAPSLTSSLPFSLLVSPMMSLEIDIDNIPKKSPKISSMSVAQTWLHGLLWRPFSWASLLSQAPVYLQTARATSSAKNTSLSSSGTSQDVILAPLSSHPTHCPVDLPVSPVAAS